MNKRLVLLAFVFVAVAAAIYYLEGMKAGPAFKIGSETSSPELAGISGYINAGPFLLSDLRGKVILVDFWTYSCINCIRTQPYLNAWYDAYSGDGLAIVGVHTPEFEFEKDYGNVKQAVDEAGIKYPVVQDNDYQTWHAFNNRYWPRKYLMDIDGNIRYDHIGEGGYDETESVIQQLLMERSERLGMRINISSAAPVALLDVDFEKLGSPEMYFGYKFDRGHLGNPEGFKPEQVVSYKLPEKISLNRAYFEGEWLNKADYSELVGTNGTIVLSYSAKFVNAVASSANATGIRLVLDGKEIESSVVSEEKLYTLVEVDYNTHLLSIEIPQPGFRIYTFTFG
jgi:thiol-disulfide isomerase/thioredoxin